MDGYTRKKIIRIGFGLAAAALFVFSAIAVVSYLFTWQADQSLQVDPDMMDKAKDVHNMAGKFGYKWADILVARGFGLPSFLLIILVGAVSLALLKIKRASSLFKTAITTLSGTLVLSSLFAFLGDSIGLGNAFGNGPGGLCGENVASASVNSLGGFMTFLILAALTFFWLMFASSGFNRWVNGSGKEKKGAQPLNDAETEQAPVSGHVHRYAEDSGDTLDTASEISTGVHSGNMNAAAHTANDDISPLRAKLLARLGNGSGQADRGGAVDDAKPLSAQPRPVSGSSSKVSPASLPDSVENAADRPEASPASHPSPVGQTGRSSRPVPSPGASSRPLEPIDVREDMKNYKFPPVELLGDHVEGVHQVSRSEIEENNQRIRSTLMSYKIGVARVTAIAGPTVTLYKVFLSPGVRSSSVKTIENDIAMSLGAKGIRLVYLSDSVGIEVANETPSMVPMKSVLNSDAFRNSKMELPVAIGYTIQQEVKTFDLTDAPHLLVAGATKQGKSVGLNVIVSSLLYAKHPTELKLVFIDPKMVEFAPYQNLLHHYLAVMPGACNAEDEAAHAIVKSQKGADDVLKSLCIEMDDRYQLLSKAGVNNIKDYNRKYKNRYLLPTEGHHFLPYIVVIIDEYADLIMSGGFGADAKAASRSVTTSIIRLAQKGRAAGLHVIIATQRPSADVVTPLIKTNFPTRIAFRTVTRFDSATILDSPGAEKLIGKGDMLYYAGVDMERVQCAYISMDEINAITDFVGAQDGYKAHTSTPYYLPELPADSDSEGPGMVDMQKLDANFEEAARLVVTSQRGSTTDIQRRLGMGYARAGKVMDQLEAAGIVGPQEGSKPRQVLVSDFNELESILEAFLSK